MITMVARMRVAPENAVAYEELLDHVTAMTLEHEPGVPYYAWAKSAEDPEVYVVIEVYRDATAHAAHMASEWVKSSLPVSRKLISGEFEIRQYVTPGQQPVELRHG